MASKKQHNLLSKAEIAKALGMTSQTFSNRQARDDKFPTPTYSNRSGSVALYSTEDAKKVYDYCTRAERERLANAEKMFESLTSGEVSFEDVELPLDADEESVTEEVEAKPEAAAPAPAKAEEKPAPAPTKEEKLAADKAAAGVTEPSAEEKAKKEAEVAAKIKAADEKIAADKKADSAKAAPAAKTTPAAPKAAPAKNQAQAPAAKTTPAKVGNGASFGVSVATK